MRGRTARVRPMPQAACAMPLLDHYATLKLAHIALAAGSVSLFALRGAALIGGARWPRATPLRRASQLVDTALLGAGIALWWLLALQPLRETWLGVKLVLILVYIALGTLAFRDTLARRARVAAYAAALGSAVAIVAVARAHDAGALLRWLAAPA